MKNYLIDRINDIDWDFTGSFSESPFSSIHWYPARFVSQIPAAIVGLLSHENDTVLDPFCGSGTTLVEAQRLNRNSIGIDICPIAKLVSESKLINVSKDYIIRTLNDLIKDSFTLPDFNHSNLDNVPKTVQIDKWYCKSVIKQLAVLWNKINDYQSTKKIISNAAFSSILLSACRETRHWGYICDNTTPKSSREINCYDKYHYVLENYKKAYLYKHKIFHDFFPNKTLPSSIVHNIDSKEILETLEDNSVDLVITSPPYYGVCDYTKSQRLSMEWFGYQIEIFRSKEIGARSKRHRKLSHDEYYKDMNTIFEHVKRIKKHQSFLVLVIGESSKRKSVIDETINNLLRLKYVLVDNIERIVPYQRRQHASIIRENILFMR